MAQLQITNEELARRGQEIYERQIRPQVEGKYDGKILAIDIETGEYEIDDEVLAAVHRVRAKHPGAPVFTLRIGYDGVHGFGGGPRHIKQ